MNRSIRWAAVGLALAAVLNAGCVLTSAQILAHYDLPNPVIIDSSNGWDKVDVDLNTISDYSKHKDKLKGLSDLAVLGTFSNEINPTPAGTVTVYITAGFTNYGSPAEITANATKLWGPATIGANPSSTQSVTIDWNTSAALFNTVGKQTLIDEAKGDGQFTLYTVGSAGPTYQIKIKNGKLVLVLEAGI
jgi:hypothetical protein